MKGYVSISKRIRYTKRKCNQVNSWTVHCSWYGRVLLPFDLTLNTEVLQIPSHCLSSLVDGVVWHYSPNPNTCCAFPSSHTPPHTPLLLTDYCTPSHKFIQKNLLPLNSIQIGLLIVIQFSSSPFLCQLLQTCRKHFHTLTLRCSTKKVFLMIPSTIKIFMDGVTKVWVYEKSWNGKEVSTLHVRHKRGQLRFVRNCWQSNYFLPSGLWYTEDSDLVLFTVSNEVKGKLCTKVSGLGGTFF